MLDIFLRADLVHIRVLEKMCATTQNRKKSRYLGFGNKRKNLKM